jgi:hypothetical protein
MNLGSGAVTLGSVTTQNNTINLGSGTIYVGTVGIGTTAPQSNLDVWGTMGVTIGGQNQFAVTSTQITYGMDTLTIPFINSTTLSTLISTTSNLTIYSSLTTANATINNGTGAITCGSINTGTGAITCGSINTGAAGITTRSITTQNNTINIGSGSIYAGTVGIGTTSPQSNLDVWGTVGVTLSNQKMFGVTSNQVYFLGDTLSVPFITSTSLSTNVLSAITINGTVTNANSAIYVASGGNIITSTITCANITSSGTLSTTNPIPWRNRIINGAMSIGQRTSNTSNTGPGQYSTVDRWCGALGTSGLTLTQCNISPAVSTGFINALQVSTTTTTASTPLIEQRIESSNILDIFAGNIVTVSFYASQTSGTLMSIVAGIYSPTTFNNFTNQTSVGSYTTGILTASLAQYSSQITLATAGILTTTFNGGLALRFTTGATATAATFLITGVQLEKGNLVTPFEIRPYSVELALCQRYYYQWTSTLGSIYPSSAGGNSLSIVGTAVAQTANSIYMPVTLPVPMRTVNYSLSNAAIGTSNFILLPGNIPITSIAGLCNSYTPTSAFLNCTTSGTPSLTIAGSYMLAASNYNTPFSFIGISAEL